MWRRALLGGKRGVAGRVGYSTATSNPTATKSGSKTDAKGANPTPAPPIVEEGPYLEQVEDVGVYSDMWTKKMFGESYAPQGGIFRSILIIGGSGALGKAVTHEFRSNNYTAINVDVNKNDKADYNILVSGSSLDQDIAKIDQELNTMKANGTRC
jgi:hypothetical protein